MNTVNYHEILFKYNRPASGILPCSTQMCLPLTKDFSTIELFYIKQALPIPTEYVGFGP